MKRPTCFWPVACALLLPVLWQTVADAAPPVVRTGLTGFRRMAVLVGVDHYESRDVKAFPDLHGCRTDVMKLADVLQRKYQFAGLPSKGAPTQPIMLLNQQATKQKILDTLSNVAAAANKYDQVLFYFSGYGSYGTQPTLCPYDAQADGPGNDIWAGDLFKFVSDMLNRKGAHGVVILDCSFCDPRAVSLGLTPAVRQKFARASQLRESPVASRETLYEPLHGIVAHNGVLISACEPGEAAREYERGDDTWMSVFTRFLTEGLAEEEDNRAVDYAALVQKITPRIRRYVAGAFPNDPINQTPHLYFDSKQDGLFSTGVAEIPKPETHRVRLRFNYFGDDLQWRDSVKAELTARPYLRVIEEAPNQSSAPAGLDQSLFLFKREDGMQGYVTDSQGNVLSELSYNRKESVSAVEFEQKVLNEVSERAGGLLAYRWPENLMGHKPLASGPKVELAITDAKGNPATTIHPGQPVTLTVSTKGPNCYVTIYGISSNGQAISYPPRGEAKDCKMVTQDEPFKTSLRTGAAARFRLLVIAKSKLEVRSDEILRSLWETTKGDYASVAGTQTKEMGEGRKVTGPPPPPFVAGTSLGTEAMVSVKCGAGLLDVVVDPSAGMSSADVGARMEFLVAPVRLTRVRATTLGQ